MRGRGGDRGRRRLGRAGGAAGPLPRPQGRADDDPARHRRPAGGGTGPVGGRQQGAQGARGAARGARRASSTPASSSARSPSDRVDVTLPGAPPRPVGHPHLIARTTRQIEDVMVGLGYRVMEGPEIEHDYYNFTALNHPPGHPARMLQDTFYVQSHPDVLLRTHTSPMQVRAMEPSRRRSSWSSPARSTAATPTPPTARCSTRSRGWRSPRGITLADLKGTLLAMRAGDLRRRARGPPAAPLLPLHRAQRRGRRLLLPVRAAAASWPAASAATSARARAGSRSSAPAWSTPTCSASSRRTAMTPSGCRASPSASGSSGWRCCATASPTCAASSTTTCGCWSSSR